MGQCFHEPKMREWTPPQRLLLSFTGWSGCEQPGAQGIHRPLKPPPLAFGTAGTVGAWCVCDPEGSCFCTEMVKRCWLMVNQRWTTDNRQQMLEYAYPHVVYRWKWWCPWSLYETVLFIYGWGVPRWRKFHATCLVVGRESLTLTNMRLILSSQN